LIAFSAALKLEPTSVHYNNRGLANFHGNYITSALEDFEEAIKLNQTSDPIIFFNKGNALLSQNMFNEALQEYDLAIQISP
jgi:tetratricopeptide (TPR) repeat protein